jgi:thymidylate synthase ThyX
MRSSATILAHSISPAGVALATLEVVLPRIVLAEFNTHRVFSRNSASSRAIPIEKMMARVKDDPFIPRNWGANQKGMQPGDEIDELNKECAIAEWLKARDNALVSAGWLLKYGVHKQYTNRLLEPWMWHTIIVSSTEWSNFFALRCHPMAQQEIRTVAEMMRDAIAASTPTPLGYGEWHMPITPDIETLMMAEGVGLEELKKISAGRCARVSYTTHHGKRDPEADIALCSDLTTNGHMSPLEHVATPSAFFPTTFTGNFKGWIQFRKYVPHENDFGARP